MIFFADSGIPKLVTDNGQSTAIGVWVLMAIMASGGALFIANQILTFIKNWNVNFGRKPSLDEDMHDLRKELQGLAPEEKVEALVNKFGTFATAAEVDIIRNELKSKVDQSQMDRRMKEVNDKLEKIERDLGGDIETFRVESRTFWNSAEHQREGLHNRINVIAEAVSEIRGWLRAKNPQADI